MRRIWAGLVLALALLAPVALHFENGAQRAVAPLVETVLPSAHSAILTQGGRRVAVMGGAAIAPVASFNASTDPFPSSILSHSRTSLAMMFDSTGKLTYAPNNLLTYSNTFSNAAWTKNTVTVTGGFTDPLGGSNATRLTATGATSYVFQSTSASVGFNAVTSIWVRRVSGSGTINLWTIGGSTGSAIVPTGTWTQYSATGNAPSGVAYAGIIIQTSGDVIEVYAATASAVTYETTPRTGDQVITTSATYYGPRIDYDPNTLAVKGLLIEENRTWVALWNRDFTNAAWTKTNVTAAKDQTGIDGVANSASSLTASANNGTVLQNITLASSQRATSAWVKRITGSGAVSMTTDGGGTWTDITSQLGAGSFARATIPAQTVTNPSVGFKFATSGDKIAVDFFGNENGAFPSSVLAVASAAVTRAADALTGASLTTYPAIIQYRDIATATRARKVINPWSGISSETDMWIERVWIYPVGTSASWLNAHLVVDGPFAANDNANPFAPQFAANDNLPVRWRIAL